MARVFLQQVNLQRAVQRNHKHITEHALLDFKSSLIISWSGMRGIVSLAIAIGLPMTLQDGTPFPERSAIIFISVAVVLFTLLGQGLTLPWLVRRVSRKTLAGVVPLVVGFSAIAGAGVGAPSHGPGTPLS